MNLSAFVVGISLLFFAGMAGAEEPKEGPCKEDIKKLCGDVKPGGGSVHACLKKNEGKVSEGCRTKMTELDTKMGAMKAEFKEHIKAMRDACKGEVEKYCAKTPKGHGAKFHCLKENMDKPEFSSACKAEVEKMKGMKAEQRELKKG